MNSNNIKSSEILRQEVLTQLDKIDTGLDEITSRMTPGQLLDDVVYYPQGGNLANTFDMMKNNPVATTFLTLGTLLLMEDNNHRTYEQVARTHVSEAVEQGRTRMHQMVNGTRQRVGQIKGGIDSVKSKIQTTKQDASGILDSAREKILGTKSQTNTLNSDSKETINELSSHVTVDSDGVIAFDGFSNDYSEMDDTQRRQAIDDAKFAYQGDGGIGGAEGATDAFKSKAQDLYGSASDKISTAADSVRQKVSSQFNDGIQSVKSMDPMTYVAIGAGLGTLTGISLPVSEAEQRLVDDKFDGTISSFTDELQAALGESADILKKMVVSDFKNLNVERFMRG